MLNSVIENAAQTMEPSLTLLNMRWGYDGGGIACGPVEGNTLVEIMIRDEKGRFYFILDSRMAEFEQILISEYPMFDRLKHMASSYADFDYEYDKLKSDVSESFDFEVDDVPEESLSESRFYKAIQLVRYAMSKAYAPEDPVEAQANIFIAPFLDKDLSRVEIPM